MTQSKKTIVIGSGFAGLSAACFMAKAGWQVQVVEKHATPGGRARQLKVDGFTFDMGPSWYWMPDVFEGFFQSFDKSVSDYYHLLRLNPSYRVYWKNNIEKDIPADYTALKQLFETTEPGSGDALDKFMAEAAYKYEVGINKLVHKPGQSLTEFMDVDLVKGLFKLDVFNSMKAHVAKYFKHPFLKELMEFPVLFLGALPEKTPALYSLMNYADIVGGTWYPEGGMYCIVEAMYQLALELGVEFYFNQNVTEIKLNGLQASGIVAQSMTNGTIKETSFDADVIIAGADYHHVETKLLPEFARSYSAQYWEKRVMAPGCLLYYVGLNKRLKNIKHHSLFFDCSFDVHGKEIYTNKQWPENPLFYVCAPSVTDATVAPEGCENLFLLIPVAAGLSGDTAELREHYFNLIIKRLEERTGEAIQESIIYQSSFAHSDFISEYNSFKGNAYGLANTLMQTSVLKPSCKSKKISNLFYTGQLTVPGPGVPPSLISGEVVAKEVNKYFSNSSKKV